MSSDNDRPRNNVPASGMLVARKEHRRRGGAKLMVMIVLAVVALAAGGVALFFGGDESNLVTAATYNVEKTDLIISVVEGATLQAAEPFEVKSEVEGQTTIINLAEEGSFVEEGALLVELDASTLIDDRNRQQIRRDDSQLAYDNALQQLELTKSQNTSDLMRAELAVELAEKDLEKYLKADLIQTREQLEAEITLADAELQRAQDQYEGTVKLQEKGYVSELELRADELTVKRRDLDLKLARRKLELLESWDKERQVLVLKNDVEQSKQELARVKTKNEGELSQARNNVKNKEFVLEREQEHLDKIEDQIAKATVHTDRAGLVVYATTSSGGRHGGDDRPIEVGATVRQRQLILSVTNSDKMVAEAKIHESQVDKVKAGQRVRITVDALPDKTFWGSVRKVAILPDSQNMWLNPDLKVYNTNIALETDGTELRPGMSCTVEILCHEIKGALAIPLQAITHKGGHLFCYVVDGGRVAIRDVEIGQYNEKVVHVVKGLQEGDAVYLAPPAGAPEPSFPDDTKLPPGVFAEAPPAEGADEMATGSVPGAGPMGPGGAESGRASFSMDQIPESAREEWRKRLDNMPEGERKAFVEKMRERGFSPGSGGGGSFRRGPRGTGAAGESRGEKPRRPGRRDAGGDRRGGGDG